MNQSANWCNRSGARQVWAGIACTGVLCLLNWVSSPLQAQTSPLAQTNILQVPDDPKARERFFEMVLGPVTEESLRRREEAASREFNNWKNGIPRPFGRPISATKSMAAVGVWTNLGPTSQPGQSYQESGRPTAILRHPTNPKILYVAEAGGGLFRCTDADTTDTTRWSWEPLTDGLPPTSTSGNTPVGVIAVDPGDPNTLFIATGDRRPYSLSPVGRGFYISHDGGGTWNSGGSLGGTTHPTAIVPITSSIILVATDAGIFRSIDAGNSFIQVPNSKGFRSLVATGGRLVGDGKLSGANPPNDTGLFYSDDQGISWHLSLLDNTFTGLNSLQNKVLATTPAQPGLVLGLFGYEKGIMKSIDGGKSWTMIRDPADKLFMFTAGGKSIPDLPDVSYMESIAIDPENANRLFVSAQSAIYRSTDGGGSWSQMCRGDWIDQHVDFQCLTLCRDSQGRMVLWAGHDGGITLYADPYRSAIPSKGQVDFSFLDTRMNRGLGTYLSYAVGSTIAVSPTDSRSRVSTGTQDNGTRFRAATDTIPLNISPEFVKRIGGDGFDSIIHNFNGNFLLATINGDWILRSIDGGLTWSTSMVQFHEFRTGFLGGNFWTRLTLKPSDSSGNSVLTPRDQRLLESNDFGLSWKDIPVPAIAPNEVFEQISVTPASSTVIAVRTSAEWVYPYPRVDPRLFITRDYGISWQSFNLPSGSYWITIDAINSQIIYLGCSLFDPGGSGTNFWKSTDGGQTWAAADGGTNFPKGIPIFQIVQDRNDPNRIYLATEFGVYRTLNAGGAWERLGQGLPMIRTFSIYLAPDGSFLRAATYGRGIWEIALTSLPDSPPAITQQPQSQSVIAGQTVVFNVVASGSGPLSYQWRKNTVDIPGAGESTLVFPAKLADSGVQLSVYVSNLAGNALSTSVGLTVAPKSRDLTGEGSINVLDLAVLMQAYGGPGVTTGNLAADLDGDGDVDDDDLNLLLPVL